MKQPAATFLACVISGALIAGASAPPQAAVSVSSASADKAKEFATLMGERKLETFAARIGDLPGTYVAVLVVPNVQLLLVSAKYSRHNDIEYSLYHKQYQNAYQDLRSGIFGTEHFFVDDAQLNGLVAMPGKNPQIDAIMIEKDRYTFDGQHGDGKGRNAKKPLTEVYMKTFADADAKYGQLLEILLTQLKAAKTLDAPGTLR